MSLIVLFFQANGGSVEELSRRSSTGSRGSVRITITNIEAADSNNTLDSPGYFLAVIFIYFDTFYNIVWRILWLFQAHDRLDNVSKITANMITNQTMKQDSISLPILLPYHCHCRQGVFHYYYHTTVTA